MHPGNVHNPKSKCRKVLEFLLQYPGEWVDGWTLTRETMTTAVSTRISEIRHQCPVEIEVQTVVGPEKWRLMVESRNEGTGWFYRVVKVTDGPVMLAPREEK